ncbi:MAG TPA: aldo/keto reductase [Galbitalea sp.]|jgi:D-threo-aldose 1-dehydrogenase|nr:aldo/keto reductase [Galbitalea sp.]
MTDARAGRDYGSTGLRVSPICLGTSGWGPFRDGESVAGRDARIEALASAFFGGELDTNLLDTSNIYGDSEAEILIGRALRAHGGLQPGLVLQTKVDRNVATNDFSEAQVWRSLEQSLERLGVDRIQMLFLHDPENIGFDASLAKGGPMDALLAIREQGIAEFIGISGGPVQVLERFVETGYFDALITHNRYTLVDRSASPLIDRATNMGMGVANAAPYGAGVLTGDPRFRGTYGYAPIRHEVSESVNAMARLCADAGVPLAAAALQFSVRDPRIHSTIVGASSTDRLDEALRHLEVEMPVGLWEQLDRLQPPPWAALDAEVTAQSPPRRDDLK